MASSNEQTLTYRQAETAYIQGNYQEAAETIDSLVLADPDNARVHLLRGHVYRQLQDYDLAQSEYESVLRMSADREVREYAQNSLEEIRYAQSLGASGDRHLESSEPEQYDVESFNSELNNDEGYQIPADGAYEAPYQEFMPASQSEASNWPGDVDLGSSDGDYYASPFEQTAQFSPITSDLESYTSGDGTGEVTYKLNVQPRESYEYSSPAVEDALHWTESDDFTNNSGLSFDRQETMLLGSSNDIAAPAFDDFTDSDERNVSEVQARQTSFIADDYPESLVGETDNSSEPATNESFNFTEDWQPEPEPEPASTDRELSNDSNPFLEGFGEFNELPGQSNRSFNNTESEPDWQDFSGNLIIQPSADATDSYMVSQPTISGNESFTVSTSSGSRLQENVSSISNLGSSSLEPRVTVKQGWLRPLENAPLKKKSLITAIASGIASTVVVGIIAAALSSNVKVPQKGLNLWQRNILIGLGAGAASFGTTLGLMTLASRSIRRSTDDLDAKLQDGIQGNFNTTAIVFAEDEFGRLATRFNQMAGVMLAITSEAQRKAQEEEQKKEDLQRQVIRLLDDVEGAARGDLTVQAEVTADVLGAVADSFNLTIENLREIVQQVKSAAQQVNQESTTTEVFARNLSAEALRQAEELAVTLNSVQVITDSIKRVADNAKEAENVARSASLTALKGGDAVEKTVEGILGIRETVAESTRKVKRLAESSQEISKIVAVISQIASRTNMLALNASIEAARAGEAGRGFAIVADEVRQLADRSAKALKEIEQIVRQIQSDTGSVMTAMEEGTQQVIEGTKLAEKAKRSLEDIITVSNRIDSLVQSITADTVEQTQTSTTVAQVMQSVEMTAQATSQEAQRVSVTLQNLVSVAQDLLNSVERFRVENN